MTIEHPERLEKVYIHGLIGGKITSDSSYGVEYTYAHGAKSNDEIELQYSHWLQLAPDIPDEFEPRSDDDVATWDETFMGTAAIWAKRSKDPNTQVGAVIVKDNHIVSTGYNGPAHGLDNRKVSWSRDYVNLRLNKYASVIHAEQNAIYNILGLGITINGSSIYTTLFPCHECAKAIVQCGIKEVIFMGIAHNGSEISEDTAAAIDRFLDSDVTLRQFIPERHLQDNMIII